MSYIKQFQKGSYNNYNNSDEAPFPKSDFPIFSNNQIIWFDNGATTHKPYSTINCIKEYYEKYNSNIHRSPHQLSMISSQMFDETRSLTAKYLGCKSNEIIFVKGTTEGVNLLANSINFTKLGCPHPTVLLTNMEHHSNIVPWQILHKKGLLELEYLIYDKTNNKINLNELEGALVSNPTIKIVSLTHVSNVLGTINPIKKIADIVHKHNRLLIIDGAQGLPHIRINVNKIGCDAYVFSGHKIFGPTGVGAIFCAEKLYDYMEPFFGGGGMIKNVDLYTSTYQDPPFRFEPGTPNIADIIAFGETLRYLEKYDWTKIEIFEKKLTEHLYESVRKIPGVEILADTIVDKVPICSFIINGIDDKALLEKLDKHGIATRHGHHCAQPILKHYGFEHVHRVSLAPYDSIAEIDYFVSIVKQFVLENTK
jgi:cysteine desulfurase / selenocysteine lyase